MNQTLVKALGSCATLAPAKAFKVRYSTGDPTHEITIEAEHMADAKQAIESLITDAVVIHVRSV
jgi:hypothetical protein